MRRRLGRTARIKQATQAAHAAIVNDWKSHTLQGNWVYFDNIGNWGTDYLDRAATAEFLLFGNDLSTSKYFDAFTDATGAQLTGMGNHAYRLMFPAGFRPAGEALLVADRVHPARHHAGPQPCEQVRRRRLHARAEDQP